MAGLQEKREARRRQILAAATTAFAEKGFQGAGMAEIAASAGVAPANLYRYFRSKQEIVSAIVEAQRVDITEFPGLLEPVGPNRVGPNTVGAEPDVLHRFLRMVVRQATAPILRALWLEVLAESGRNPGIAEILAADDRHLTAAFAAVLRQARQADEIAADIDLDATARWLIALMDGMVARSGYDPSFDPDRFITETETLLRRALAPRELAPRELAP